jgi:serpin B
MKLLTLLPLLLLPVPAAAQERAAPTDVPSPAASLVGGMNRFGLELFGQLTGQPGDLAFSPASASTAFGLAYAGARGGTAEEIAATLRYPAVPDFHVRFGTLLKSMALKGEGRTLSVANALWVHRDTVIHADYAALVDRYYGAGLKRVDFKGDKAGASAAINAWVEAHTNKRIRDVIKPENIKRDTRAMLVNTVHFKADWAEPFDPTNTRPESFKLADGRTIQQPLMYQHDDFRWAEQDGVKAIALPYRGGETEMIVLLPGRAEEIGKLERSLDAGAFDAWMARLQSAGPQPVKLWLPKFKLNRRMTLVAPLRALGLRLPFTDASDFSGIKPVDPTSADREGWNLKIGDAIQQVFVEVDEKGTEAAAATVLGMVIVTGMRAPVEFRADRPFLFAIRDRRNGALLFVGRFSGEAGSEGS